MVDDDSEVGEVDDDDGVDVGAGDVVGSRGVAGWGAGCSVELERDTEEPMAEAAPRGLVAEASVRVGCTSNW